MAHAVCRLPVSRFGRNRFDFDVPGRRSQRGDFDQRRRRGVAARPAVAHLAERRHVALGGDIGVEAHQIGDFHVDGGERHTDKALRTQQSNCFCEFLFNFGWRQEITLDQGLEVLPVLNKIDLPQAEPERVSAEIEDIIGISTEDVLCVSAKTGEGVPDLLERLVEAIPPPEGDPEGDLQALIIDSWFDNYLGIVSLVRVVEGRIAKGEKIDHRSDLYSLGVILFRLLTGQLPIPIQNANATLAEIFGPVLHAHDQGLPRVSSLRTGVPDWLDDLVARLLDKDPSARPKNGADLAYMLELHPTRPDGTSTEEILPRASSGARLRPSSHPEPAAAIRQ